MIDSEATVTHIEGDATVNHVLHLLGTGAAVIDVVASHNPIEFNSDDFDEVISVRH